MFDEPLSNLDAQLRDGMREEIKRLHAELGKTFVYVTHDQIEAMTLADHILLLKDGVIEQAGTPLQLFDHPQNRFVAGFLGSPTMNFIDVTVSGNGALLELPGGQTLDLAAAALSVPDGPYCWGVRPEHLTDEQESVHMIDAVIEVAQPTGSRTYGSFNLGSAHVVAELGAHTVNVEGRKIRLSVSLDRTSFFDPHTENRVSANTAG